MIKFPLNFIGRWTTTIENSAVETPGTARGGKSESFIVPSNVGAEFNSINIIADEIIIKKRRESSDIFNRYLPLQAARTIARVSRRGRFQSFVQPMQRIAMYTAMVEISEVMWFDEAGRKRLRKQIREDKVRRDVKN